MREAFSAFASQFFEPGFYSMDVTFVFCAVVLLGHLDRSARTIAHRLVDFAVLLVAEGLLSFAKYLVTGETGSLPVFVAIIVGYALVQDELRTTDKVVRCATFLTSLILLIGITGVLVPAIDVLRTIPFGSELPNVASFALLVGICAYLRRFSISGFGYVPRDYAYLVVAICAVAAVSGRIFMRFNGTLIGLSEETVAEGLVSDVSTVNLVVDVGLLVLVLVAYRMFFLLSKEHEQRGANLIIRRQASDNAETISVTKQVYEQMREVRHETRNHIAYMQALLEAKDYGRLEEYLGAFREETSDFLAYVQTCNPTIDAVVNAKIAQAQARGVEVKTMLAVPHDLGFSDEDLYSLLANLMDNAIEGAVESEAEEKAIRLQVRPEGGYYVVSVQNPCAHREDESGPLTRLKTTKADKDVHGYGTKLVARIARRHKGTARYQVKDDVFTVNVMLAQRARSAAVQGDGNGAVPAGEAAAEPDIPAGVAAAMPDVPAGIADGNGVSGTGGQGVA